MRKREKEEEEEEGVGESEKVASRIYMRFRRCRCGLLEIWEGPSKNFPL
jgi:hypothetical protein